MSVVLLERRVRGRPPLLKTAVLAELTDRCSTASAISGRIGCTRATALQVLYDLELNGKVRRAGRQERLTRGRPHLRWRRVEAKI